MFSDFKKYIDDNDLIASGDRILMAVSGGIDSMVMGHLLLRAGYSAGIAHCNFGLRGDESVKDEELVRTFASENGIPFHVTRFNTTEWAREHGLSIQMAARELRYKWFEELMDHHDYTLLAVAHNMNDNAETLLINLARGSGSAGLSGIRMIRNRIIRPLLFATRNQIEEYCADNCIIYREDKSNADIKYTRNKIRHKILPVLREINPSIENTLMETSERFSEINQIISIYIENLRKQISSEHGTLVSFSIEALRPYINNRTILYELFKPYGISSTMLRDAAELLKSRSGAQIRTSSHRIIRNRNEITISPDIAHNEVYYQIECLDDLGSLPFIESAKQADVSGSFEISAEARYAYIDSAKLVFPLIIRSWKPGDRFYPLGMKLRKKLSDYFIDRKYSFHEKESKLVLESDGKIVWIIGDRLDDRFRISKSTKTAIIIKSKGKEPEIIPLR